MTPNLTVTCHNEQRIVRDSRDECVLLNTSRDDIPSAVNRIQKVISHQSAECRSRHPCGVSATRLPAQRKGKEARAAERNPELMTSAPFQSKPGRTRRASRREAPWQPSRSQAPLSRRSTHGRDVRRPPLKRVQPPRPGDQLLSTSDLTR